MISFFSIKTKEGVVWKSIRRGCRRCQTSRETGKFFWHASCLAWVPWMFHYNYVSDSQLAHLGWFAGNKLARWNIVLSDVASSTPIPLTSNGLQSYTCCHNCPGADKWKCSSQSVPLGTPEHHPTFTYVHTRRYGWSVWPKDTTRAGFEPPTPLVSGQPSLPPKSQPWKSGFKVQFW